MTYARRHHSRLAKRRTRALKRAESHALGPLFSSQVGKKRPAWHGFLLGKPIRPFTLADLDRVIDAIDNLDSIDPQ
jgi:hypothetical protein